ncbi:MAG: S53 family peptidase [Chloroflexota bacterium]|nr:S53 family peptidase [Chloroflexota bacterium]
MSIDTWKRVIPIVILGLLLVACSSPGGGTATTIPTATTVRTAVPRDAPSTQIDTCPTLPFASADVYCYTPHQLRMAYGVESLIEHGFTGKGQTIVDIVSFGSPTLQQDMDIFDKQFGLPPVTVQVISPLNTQPYDPNGDRGGWAGETELDVQIMHAIAPDAHIVVLVSPVAETEGTIGLSEFRQLVQYSLDHHLGNIISQSWGASEVTLRDPAGQQEIQKWDTIFHQASTQQGITFFGSSGDNGASDFTDLKGTILSSTPTTSFPTDDPWVTSVGGTTLARHGSTLTETAWSDSGGGFSKFFPQPVYQKLLPAAVQGQFNQRRGVPDVSAAADPQTGLAFYSSGGWSLVGGTSASAPLWSGIAAIADQVAGHPLGFINLGLYKLATSSTYAQDFRDITAGNNSVHKSVNVTGYSAVPGWDPVSGLGTPNAEKLIPDLIAALKS